MEEWCQWTVRLESPVGRSPLSRAEPNELLAPAPVWPKRQPLHDEAVDRFQHQHLGQHELPFRGRLQLGSGFIAQAQQFITPDRILVALDPLKDVLLVMLLIGIG